MLTSILLVSCATTPEKRELPPIKVGELILSKAIRKIANSATAIDISNHFSTSDTRVVASVHLEGLSGTHELRWEWYDPKGECFLSSGNHAIHTSEGKYRRITTAWHNLPIKGDKAMYRQGTWQVKLFFNEDLVAEKKFTIKESEKEKPPKISIKGEKVRIGIVEFQNLNEQARKENLGLIFSEILTTSFVNSEAFKITEREQLEKVARELQLSQTGIIDVTQAKQLGKMVGADAVVIGSVTKIGSDLRLDARIIDVQSGIILTAEKVEGKVDLKTIGSMADHIVNDLVYKFYKDKI